MLTYCAVQQNMNAFWYSVCSLNTTRATGTGSPCFALLEQPVENVLYPWLHMPEACFLEALTETEGGKFVDAQCTVNSETALRDPRKLASVPSQSSRMKTRGMFSTFLEWQHHTQCNVLCWLGFCQTDARHLGRGTSAEKMPPSNWPVGKSGDIFLINDRCGRAQTTVGWAISGKVACMKGRLS